MLPPSPGSPKGESDAQNTPVQHGRELSPDVRSGIFISYRKTDVPEMARRLHDRLSNEFDPVFVDLDAVVPGPDVMDRVQRSLSHCIAQVVLIGGDWLTAQDEYGRRRLYNADDVVRLEVETAL